MPCFRLPGHPGAAFAALLLSLLFPLLSLTSPAKNWDIVGYTAVALAHQAQSPEALHAATWEALNKDLGDTTQLREGSPYAQAIAADPQALRQQLPYYQPRLAYVWLSTLLAHGTGIGIPKATILVSGLALSGVFLLLYFNFARHLAPAAALFVVCALAASLHWLFLARASSPDALATLFGLTAITSLYAKRPRLFTLLSVLLILTRHDQIILATLLICLHEPGQWRRKALQMLALAVAFAYVYVSSRWYGWGLLLMHTFVAPYAYPAQASLSVQQIAQAYIGQWQAMLTEWKDGFASLLPLGAGALATALLAQASAVQKRLLSIFLLSMLLKLILFPAISGLWSRLYAVEITGILFVATAMLGAHSKASKQ